MPYVRVVDVIPNSDSAEAYQHSEPSLAVDPFDPTQIIVGAFGFPDLFPNTPYFKSTDGGATWSSYGRLFSQDKSIAWTQDGSTALTATLLSDVIRTRLGTAAASDFGSPINAFDPSHELDQPWIRTGPSGHVYVAYNDLSARPNTASVLVSTNGGSDYTPFTLDRVGGSAPYPFDLDAPSVRLAVNGDTVYGVFVRFNTVVQNDPGDRRAGSQVVVVRSDNGGADGFIALGDGVEVAATIWADTDNVNSPLGLGQERTGSELAIAVDPNNPNRLVVAYSDAPVLGQLQLVVAESIDGGATWTTKFTTSSSTRSAQPALAILESGGVGLLYNNYDPLTDKLSQHLLTTTDDFATTTDITLATESNATPALQSHPYVGDFFDLTSVGDTFFGIFSASNADNGTDAQFPNVSFLRPFTGALGMSSFQLTDAAGNPVAISIDPFFFSYSPLSTPWILLADGDFTGDGIADLMSLDPSTGDTIEWVMSPAGGVGSIPFTSGVQGWNLLADGDFNGDGTTDLMWQHASSGATAEWLMAPTGGVGSMLSTPGAEGWSLIADGDFNGDGTTDLMWQHASSGATAEWLMAPTGGVGVLLSTPLAQGWNLIATGDFNGDGTTDSDVAARILRGDRRMADGAHGRGRQHAEHARSRGMEPARHRRFQRRRHHGSDVAARILRGDRRMADGTHGRGRGLAEHAAGPGMEPARRWRFQRRQHRRPDVAVRILRGDRGMADGAHGRGRQHAQHAGSPRMEPAHHRRFQRRRHHGSDVEERLIRRDQRVADGEDRRLGHQSGDAAGSGMEPRGYRRFRWRWHH